MRRHEVPQAEDSPSRRQPKHRRPPQPHSRHNCQKHRGTAPDKGHCTRYVAVHPLRGGAPEQKRCIAYGSGAVPQHTRKNAELAYRTTHRHTPPCAARPYWQQDEHAAHATTCTPAHSNTSHTLTCEEPFCRPPGPLRQRPGARLLPQPVLTLCSLPGSGEPPDAAAARTPGVHRRSVRCPIGHQYGRARDRFRSRALTGSVSMVSGQLAPSVTVTLKSVVMPSLSVRVTVTGSASSPVTLSGCRVMMFLSGLPAERVSGSEMSTL